MTEKEWLNGNQLSLDIYNKKYRNGDESFDEFLDRVSHGYEPIKRLIEEKKFSFGGRILASRGVKNRKVTYSNCYVIQRPDDNIESIFECCSKLARTYSYGGGCGIDISNLRPNGAKVHNASKTSSGPISFMDMFSQITQTISQNGRRGALMISLDINHPDIEEFIDCKTDLERVKYANISVRVNDLFMEAVSKKSSNYILSWPCDKYETGIDTSNWKFGQLYEVNGVYYKKVDPVKIFNKLVKNNWDYAEPGILYWDRIEQYNLLNNTEFRYAGTNPCAEEPLPAGGSCLLGSINLSEFVLNPFTKNAKIDYEALEEAVCIAVVGLNQVLIEGLNLHPLQEQRESVKDWRQIGLGTMGLADMLIKIGVTYGSEKSLRYLDEIYKTIAITAIQQSLELAKSHGYYPKCEKEKLVDSAFIKALNLPESIIKDIKKYGLYNSQLLTCAPTGSIGTMFEISTGVEPNFALSYTRKTQSLDGKDTFYQVDARIVKEYKEATNNTKLPDYFITSATINPIDRVKVQSCLQKYTDASISSTVNLPKEATVEDVSNIYLEAWKQGLKGITIYRSGCKREGILTTEPVKNDAPKNELSRGYIVKAEDNCIGLKRTLTTGCGTLHCTAYFHPETGELLETYLSKGSKGGCQNFMIGLSRMISLSARGGIGINAIIDQLNSCGVCPSYAVRSATKHDTSPGSCCPIAVGRALKDMHKEMQNRLKSCIPIEENSESSEGSEEYDICPECGKRGLTHSGGCDQCILCGYSKCV